MIIIIIIIVTKILVVVLKRRERGINPKKYKRYTIACHLLTDAQSTPPAAIGPIMGNCLSLCLEQCAL